MKKKMMKKKLRKLPVELRDLIASYRSVWGSSARSWGDTVGSFERQEAMIRASDRLAEQAGSIATQIREFCGEHRIDFRKVSRLMN